eukprot:1175522-Prorocentrum_minimum.AAC.1
MTRSDWCGRALCRYLGVLPPLPRQIRGDEVPDGAEEPVRRRDHSAIPPAVRCEGVLCRTVRAHHPA